MDLHEHPGGNSRQNRGIKKRAVIADAHLVAGVDEEDVAVAQRVEER